MKKLKSVAMLRTMSSVKRASDGKFEVTIDTAAFMEEVQKYLDLSPVMAEWQDVKKLTWPSALIPPALWVTFKDIKELVSVSCAAIELAKQSVVKSQDPDGKLGLKFDKELALSTAVTLVSKLIKFQGTVGYFVNKLWLPLLNLIISVYIAGQDSNWTSIALSILKIAIV